MRVRRAVSFSIVRSVQLSDEQILAYYQVTPVDGIYAGITDTREQVRTGITKPRNHEKRR